MLTALKRLLVLPLLAASVACTGHASLTAPSGASLSATTAASTSVSAGATIVGTVSGVSSAARAGMHVLSTSSVTVTVVGTSVSASVDASGSFTLTNVPAGQVVLTFSGPGIDASLSLGAVAENDRVQVSVTLNGTTATLDAQQRTSPTAGDPSVTLKGVVSAVTGACPSLWLSVGGASVQTSASTTFSAKGCSEIASGDTAGVAGTKRSDGTVSATIVEVAKAAGPVPPTPAPTPTPTPEPPATVTMNGTIVGVGGACPALTLKVDTTYVRTDGATTFSGRACGELKSGDAVGVAGTRQSDGTILATKIVVTAPAPTPQPTPTPTPTPEPTATVTMNGTIIGFGGACPTLTIKVDTTYVRTDGATTFSGRACGELKSGDAVGVAGTRQSDGMILASKIVVTAPAPTPPPTTSVTVSGTLGTFSGPCPNLQMLVSGTYVRTNASTTFSGKACGDLKSGDVLTAIASNTGDNLGLLASKIYVTGSAPVPPPVPATLSGTVGGFGGSCPALELKVGGTYVITNAATTFSGKSCGELKTGDTVQVVGTHPADSGTVTATTLTLVAPAPVTPPTTVTLSGTIVGVGGACPTLTMKVDTTYVRTSSATTFTGKSCSEFKTGDTVGVAGTKQTDGSVAATQIYANK